MKIITEGCRRSMYHSLPHQYLFSEEQNCAQPTTYAIRIYKDIIEDTIMNSHTPPLSRATTKGSFILAPSYLQTTRPDSETVDTAILNQPQMKVIFVSSRTRDQDSASTVANGSQDEARPPPRFGIDLGSQETK